MKKKNFLLRGVALLLVLMTLLPLMSACGTKDNPVDPTEPDEYGFIPTVRFAVSSDIHTRGKDPDDYNSRDMMTAFMQSAYKYSESQPYNKLDGIFVVGDYTQNGNASTDMYKSEMPDFFDIVKANTKEGTFFKAVLGNHEFYYTKKNDGTNPSDPRYSDTSVKNTVANHLKYSGDAALDEHVVINGFHFIFLSMDMYDKTNGIFYSKAKLDWLRAELKIAAEDDETGLKPIFVFEHIGPKGDIIGGADKQIGTILSKYPQVVNFCGHSHTTLTDPRTINQKSYTALNTGSLAYLGIPIAGHPQYGSTGTTATDRYGSFTVSGDTENYTRTGGMYYIIEMNAENVMRVRIYNIFTDSFWGEPIYIDSIGKLEEFDMTNDRAKASKAPAFAEDAELSSVFIAGTTALFRIPNINEGELAQNYRCELSKGDTNAGRFYRLAGLHFGESRPAEISLPLPDLEPNTTYTLRVFPINVWGKEGQPIECRFTTGSTDDTTPTIFSAQFNTDGSAVNGLTGEQLDIIGKPQVEYDAALDRNVAIFSGQDAYTWHSMDQWYKMMSTSFTVETYILFDEIPSNGYVDGISNQQSGGFGFEYKSNGNIYFFCSAGENGAYIKPSAYISEGEWIHLAAVFDGKKLRLYVNGDLKATATAADRFMPPVAYSQYLAIGADSAANGNVSSNMSGKIASVNIYSEALTAEQIAALYQEY